MTSDREPATGPRPATDRPGLQATRTRLAWRRSVLGVLVGALLALRGALVVERWPAGVSALALAAVVGVLAVVWATARRRATALGGPSAPAEDAAPLAGRQALAVSGAVAVLAAVALATLL